METNTARNFALQLGSLISLYISLSALVTVVFGVINILYPDATNGSWEYASAQQGVRIGIAMLFVFFPTYIVLTRFVNKIRRKETGTYLTLTKWLVYLSLLVGGGILLGDLVAVILTYLNGEISVRFILKAITLCIAIGSAFYYYIQDARSYWNTHEKYSQLYALVASLLVIVIIVIGFLHSDSPTKTREMKLDDKEISDLNDMQYRIDDAYMLNKTLPVDIASLYVGIEPPSAPANRAAYEYATIDETSYKLCATFAYPSQNSVKSPAIAPTRPDGSVINNTSNNWDHGTGKTCFQRTVTPAKGTN